MKRNALIAFGILGMVLVTTLVLSKGERSDLRVQILSSEIDASGLHRVSLVVTNGSFEVFPNFATVTTPDGEIPYVIVQTETAEGWTTSVAPTNRYAYTHRLLGDESWSFQTSLDPSDYPQRVVLRYTVGVRADDWIRRKGLSFLKKLGLAKDWRELRSKPFQANQSLEATAAPPGS